MSNFKYKTSEEVFDAIKSGNLKRNSGMVMKRQAKKDGNLDYMTILDKGIKLYDTSLKSDMVCSFYGKLINNLSLYELVDLEDKKPELFSYKHKIRYSILMLGGECNVEDYKGVVITPTEVKQY
ncbi:hypothetical protein VP277E431_P0111 [Vibrio phage 277E43-1]|nr:hypothetical protein VP277E431_P0111 [Vibrio phage 277E43-1]